jgi:gas vesicle protein
MNSTKKILTAFAAGAAAGTVYGILMAPDKGTRTRRKISRQGKKIVFGVQDKISESKDRLVDLKEDIVKAVKEKVEEFI